MLQITKRTTKRVPVEVLELRTLGPLRPVDVAANFRCTACRSKLGANIFGVAWIREADGKERSMRLCCKCVEAAQSESVKVV